MCVFPDLDETGTLLLRHGALSHRRGPAVDADATITISRADLNDVILGTITVASQIEAGRGDARGGLLGARRPRRVRVLVQHRDAMSSSPHRSCGRNAG